MRGEFAWRPTDDVIRRARLTAFLQHCGAGDFHALYRRSIEEIPWFTGQVLRFLALEFHQPYTEVVDLSRGIQWPRWCVGGGLNIAVNCVDRHARAGLGHMPAVLWQAEEGADDRMSYAQLLEFVEQCAAGLRGLGIGKGDAVGLHLPMLPETAVALLALARIGAVAVPLFSGYGPAALESRLRDVNAKALITCDAFPRRGALVPAKQVADEAAARCPSLRNLIVVRRTGILVPMRKGRDLYWDKLPKSGDASAEPTAAEDPLIVLYTSGTTGKPKGILHTHCGFPVKAAQDMAFGTDVGPGDRIAWITDIGWIMGPWLIYGATLLGATCVLYDGAPDHPKPDRLWRFCTENQVNILGISPTLVRALAAHGPDLPRAHDLSALRILGSTGEPWNPEPWWWLFDNVGRGRVPIINYSGGTEISGGILMGNPLLPIKPCSFPAACPGIAADVVGEDGNPVRGTVGELVIRAPWIGMARGFLNDPERYLDTYWSRWPNLWAHGDWARIDQDGHWYILGRSDDTLKIAGKRVGPAEVESVLVGHPGVIEAAVIGVPDDRTGTCMVAFCVPAARAGAELAADLRQRVAEALGKPLRPARIVFVPALPRTRNAKVMRRVIRAAYLGEDPGDLSALENPEAVEAIAGARAAAPGRSS